MYVCLTTKTPDLTLPPCTDSMFSTQLQFFAPWTDFSQPQPLRRPQVRGRKTAFWASTYAATARVTGASLQLPLDIPTPPSTPFRSSYRVVLLIPSPAPYTESCCCAQTPPRKCWALCCPPRKWSGIHCRPQPFQKSESRVHPNERKGSVPVRSQGSATGEGQAVVVRGYLKGYGKADGVGMEATVPISSPSSSVSACPSRS